MPLSVPFVACHTFLVLLGQVLVLPPPGSLPGFPSQPSGVSLHTESAIISQSCCPKCLPFSKWANPVSATGSKMLGGKGGDRASLARPGCSLAPGSSRTCSAFPPLVLLLLTPPFSLSQPWPFCVSFPVISAGVRESVCLSSLPHDKKISEAALRE